MTITQIAGASLAIAASAFAEVYCAVVLWIPAAAAILS